MKFSEKLQTLRKDMKMSQEQLADMLDVSRQSVSKWESGQTYPEMDKLLELCKIFKCTLDDLTNDEVKEIKKGDKEKNSISNLVDSFLDLIKRSYEMLKKMKFKNIIGCFLEMLLVFLIILFFHNIVNYIYNLGSSIFIHFGNTASDIICSIWKSLLEIIYIILGVIVFIYIYKIRYLDRYDNFKVVNENLEKEVEVNQDKRENMVIIKKESSNGFFDVLGAIVLFFIKIFVFFMAVPFIFSLVSLGMFFIISIILLFSGVFYIGINFMILAAILLNLVFLYLVYYFIFNKKVEVKKTLIVILGSLLLFGVGFGITTINVANTNFVNNVDDVLDVNKKEQVFNMNNSMYVKPDYYNINYIEDNTLKNQIKIEVLYYEKFKEVSITNYDNIIDISDNHYNNVNFKDMYKLVIKDLQKKNIHNYGLFFEVRVNVYGTPNNIKILKDNQKNYLTAYEEEYNYYDETISDLEEDIEEKDNSIMKLEEQVYDLESQNNELKDKINNYKDQLSSLLNE